MVAERTVTQDDLVDGRAALTMTPRAQALTFTTEGVGRVRITIEGRSTLIDQISRDGWWTAWSDARTTQLVTGNLAHALKTPVSVMLAEAEATPGPLSEVVRRQAEALRGHVEHHLRRARAAARSTGVGERTEVAPVLDELSRALGRIFANDTVIDWDAPDELADGAETQVWLATSDDPGALVTGRYLYRREQRRANPAAYEVGLQDGLLAACAKLTGVTLPG